MLRRFAPAGGISLRLLHLLKSQSAQVGKKPVTLSQGTCAAIWPVHPKISRLLSYPRGFSLPSLSWEITLLTSQHT